MSYVLAFDLGASSGRAMLGHLHGGKIELEEIHRFANDPVLVNGRLHWDILRLFHELKQGLLKVKQREIKLDSLAIDTWAVDFGLLDEAGQLLANPFHYRDARNNEAFAEAIKLIGEQTLYEKTGIQQLTFNTIFQFIAMHKQKNTALAQGKHFLMIPSLLRFFLTGRMVNEFTNATTTQLLNATTKQWDKELLAYAGLDVKLLGDVVKPGTFVGQLQPSICEELNIEPIAVIATAEHDTAAAVAAVPATEPSFIYISSGTWSLMGTEISSPLLTKQAASLNFTNEGGVNDTYRLLKNIMGMWMINECKREWDSKGEIYSFSELVQLAEQAEPFQHYLDVDDESFLGSGNMLTRIDLYCEKTKQHKPTSVGAYARAIYEGLAFKYRYTLEQIESLTGEKYRGIHIVGGGIQNELLCQWTADATGVYVWAGPVEASALGNMLVQWIASGCIDSLQEGRAIIKETFNIKQYAPKRDLDWNSQYENFKKVL